MESSVPAADEVDVRVPREAALERVREELLAIDKPLVLAGVDRVRKRDRFLVAREEDSNLIERGEYVRRWPEARRTCCTIPASARAVLGSASQL